MPRTYCTSRTQRHFSTSITGWRPFLNKAATRSSVEMPNSHADHSQRHMSLGKMINAQANRTVLAQECYNTFQRSRAARDFDTGAVITIHRRKPHLFKCFLLKCRTVKQTEGASGDWDDA